jgi:hypothetical protein
MPIPAPPDDPGQQQVGQAPSVAITSDSPKAPVGKLAAIWHAINLPLASTIVGGLFLLAAGLIVNHYVGSDDSQNRGPAATSQTATTSAPPAPALIPAGSSDPRAQIVQLTGSWSDAGFVSAIVDRDTRIVALYLQSGMAATTLSQGASAILFGFQGVPQNGDPVALVKTFQANGFKVDDELEDSRQNPVPFNTPLTPKGYAGGEGGKFVGSLVFWIVERATWNGANDQDIQVIKYLISEGADCKVPLSFLTSVSYLAGDGPYQQLFPMMQSCAK